MVLADYGASVDEFQTQLRGVSSRHWLYYPSIPSITFAVVGFGPSHTDESTGRKAGPAMVSLSLPLMARVVPVPGRPNGRARGAPGNRSMSALMMEMVSDSH